MRGFFATNNAYQCTLRAWLIILTVICLDLAAVQAAGALGGIVAAWVGVATILFLFTQGNVLVPMTTGAILSIALLLAAMHYSSFAHELFFPSMICAGFMGASIVGAFAAAHRGYVVGRVIVVLLIIAFLSEVMFSIR